MICVMVFANLNRDISQPVQNVLTEWQNIISNQRAIQQQSFKIKLTISKNSKKYFQKRISRPRIIINCKPFAAIWNLRPKSYWWAFSLGRFYINWCLRRGELAFKLNDIWFWTRSGRTGRAVLTELTTCL